MRADRLVAILLLLQRRGLVTAKQVADELEISERTARRDLDALGVAGLPVYASRGRGGGWKLAGGGRTDLSGLSDREVRALFLLAGPRSSAEPELRAALRKLVRALPEPFQTQAEAASRSVIVDPSGWGSTATSGPPPSPEFLDIVQEAVVVGRVIRMGYINLDGRSSLRMLHPLGLAVKGSLWYLIADTDAGLRTFRVDRVTSVELTDDAVVQPPAFDLDAAWKLISDEIRERRLPVRVKAIARGTHLRTLRYVLGDGILIGIPSSDGWVRVELRAESVEAIVGRIAGFGNCVVVENNDQVRHELARVGAELTKLYGRESA